MGRNRAGAEPAGNPLSGVVGAQGEEAPGSCSRTVASWLWAGALRRLSMVWFGLRGVEEKKAASDAFVCFTVNLRHRSSFYFSEIGS